MKALSGKEIEGLCRRERGWIFADGRIAREWKFADFLEAMQFVNRVADLAERAGHHPDIEIHYNHVRLGLVTHDAGGLTARDADMAARLNLEFPPPEG